MRVALLACAATLSAVTLAACGSSSGTAPTVYPAVGGQYTATFTYTDSNANFDSTKTVGATIVLQNPNDVGQLTGYTVFPANDSGLVFASFGSTSLSSLTFQIFGDVASPLFFSKKVLAAEFPECNFGDQGTYTPMTVGSISSASSGAQLTMAGTLTGFKCGADSSVSTLAASVTATRM